MKVMVTLLCIRSVPVIPAKAGIQAENTGSRVKPGMTKRKETSESIHYPSGLHNNASIGDKDTLLQREEGIEIHLLNRFFLQSHLGQTDQ